MKQAGEDFGRPSAGNEVVRLDSAADNLEWADLRPAADWIRSHRILLCALAMTVAELAWKAQFLSRLYFRQDDFHDLELAVEHPFTWSYLTYIGSGHLIIGLRIVAWLLVRVSGTYNWGLASAVSLAFVAAASLAAYGLLRNLFGDRPAILVPLALYMLSPLTMPDLGIWSSAMESVPLQLAIFMALNSHVNYVRSRRVSCLLSAIFWVVFGLIFFEKGLVVPILLFAVTAAFLTGKNNFLAGAFSALIRYWQAWLIYIAIMIGYAVLLVISLHTSAVQPQAPDSGSAVAAFMWGLLRESFLPGAFGGPWQWLPTSDHSYAFSAPPYALMWLSALGALAVVAVSIWRRPIAWRAWLILIGWVVLADVLPVVIGRVNAFAPAILGLESRYLADAVPVLVVCVGLAFWPIADDQQALIVSAGHPVGHRRQPTSTDQALRTAAAALVGVFIFGSIWSVQEYESVVSGSIAKTYIANAGQALKLAPRGTPVFDESVPTDVEEGLFGRYAVESKVIGDMARGRLAHAVHWVVHPQGTVDGLRMFAGNGQLHLAQVVGAVSLAHPGAAGCWPTHRGRIVVRLSRDAPAYTGIMRIGYIWSLQVPGQVQVSYGGAVRTLVVSPGLNSGYVPVKGSADTVVLRPLGGGALCVGDVEVGNLAPSATGEILPPVSH